MLIDKQTENGFQCRPDRSGYRNANKVQSHFRSSLETTSSVLAVLRDDETSFVVHSVNHPIVHLTLRFLLLPSLIHTRVASQTCPIMLLLSLHRAQHRKHLNVGLMLHQHTVATLPLLPWAIAPPSLSPLRHHPLHILILTQALVVRLFVDKTSQQMRKSSVSVGSA